jgi:predicted aspartyl protease
MHDMGTFRVDIEIESPITGARRQLGNVLVDTGAELSWVPGGTLEELGIARRKVWHFRQANGTVLERWTGFVIVHVAGTETADEIVFGEPGDLTLLGARSLEGLNLRVDPVTKRLVDAGPAPAAIAAQGSVRRSLRGDLCHSELPRPTGL